MTARWQITLVLIFMGSAIGMGTAGYVIIEDQDVISALYMTVITITSVGYGEVFELSTAGRYLSMGLAFFGLLAMVGSVTILTSLLVESQLPVMFQRRKMKRQINRLDDHLIICGAGDMAMVIVEEMLQNDKPFVIVDSEQSVLDDLLERQPDLIVYHGDATEDETLEEVGIKRADSLVSTLPTDAENLFVCLAARELNRDLNIVTRIEHQENKKRMEKAGADGVISPRVTGGQRMVNLILQPDIVSFLDIIHQDRSGTYRMEKVRIEEGSDLAGKTLAEAAIPEKTGLIVISRDCASEGKGPEFNPTSSSKLNEGDQLVVLGEPDQIRELREFISPAGLS